MTAARVEAKPVDSQSEHSAVLRSGYARRHGCVPGVQNFVTTSKDQILERCNPPSNNLCAHCIHSRFVNLSKLCLEIAHDYRAGEFSRSMQE